MSFLENLVGVALELTDSCSGLRGEAAMPRSCTNSIAIVGFLMALPAVYFVFGPLQAFFLLVFYVGFLVLHIIVRRRRMVEPPPGPFDREDGARWRDGGGD